MVTTYQEFEARLDTLHRNIEALNRDCQQRNGITPERVHQCSLWAMTQWLNAINANDREKETMWSNIANELAQLCETLN